MGGEGYSGARRTRLQWIHVWRGTQGGAPIKTRLRLQILGLDDEPRLRRGDLSLTGLYVEYDREVGPLGSIQRLVIGSPDGQRSVAVVARLVRIASVQDFWRGDLVAGLAFQFLCEATGEQVQPVPAAESKAIAELVRHVLHLLNEADLVQLEHRWLGTLRSDAGEQHARISSMSLRGLVLETDVPVPVGETVRVEIPEPGTSRPVQFLGRAVVSTRDAAAGGVPSYRTDVRFERDPAATPRPRPDSISDAVETLLGATLATATAPALAAAPQPLSGLLSRISLTSVLALCAVERVTGVVLIESSADLVRIFLRDGRPIDAVDQAGEKPPEQVLSGALRGEDARFEVSFEPVERAERLDPELSGRLLAPKPTGA